MKIKRPKILGPDQHDFHDSYLVDIELERDLSKLVIWIEIEDDEPKITWQIEFIGLLKFEFETLGVGIGEQAPIEIYDIYSLEESEEISRWGQRLERLGDADPKRVKHIVLASSFYRGWGEREPLEGIELICRDVVIRKE